MAAETIADMAADPLFRDLFIRFTREAVLATLSGEIPEEVVNRLLREAGVAR